MTYIAPEILFRTDFSSDSGRRIQTGAIPSMASAEASRVSDGSSGHPIYFSTEVVPRLPYGNDSNARTDTMAASGHPELEMLRQGIRVGGASQSPFLGVPEQYAVLLANPYVAGWEYQSFGVWDSDFTSPAIVATSYGNTTPAAAIPTIGKATFTGKMAGLYVSPNGNGSIASANLTVQADFASRSLALSTAGTTLTQNPALAGQSASHLDFNGTLAYTQGSGSFAGAIVTADGALSGSTGGQFYGPAAQELGGVFALKSATTGATLSGAYGAKR